MASTDPRLGLQWQLNPSTQLHVNWGRFHQIDEIQELKVEDGLVTFPPPQQSEHLILGVEHQLANGVGLRLEAYSKQQSQAAGEVREPVRSPHHSPRDRAGPDRHRSRTTRGSTAWN